MRMRLSPEMRGVGAVSLVVALYAGGTACAGDTESGGRAITTPTVAGSEVPAPTTTEIIPRDVLKLKQVSPDSEGRQCAWKPDSPQPWGAGDEVQVDSRCTKPVGGPVGVYRVPRQDREQKFFEAQDGEEYSGVCYVYNRRAAQFIQNDQRDGTNLWIGLDVNRDGNFDQVYLPSANAGFTGLNPMGQPDGRLPVCPS
ncbi:MAG: hypothetical protein AAB834_02700 [Patescibacteria group bacterium]